MKVPKVSFLFQASWNFFLLLDVRVRAHSDRIKGGWWNGGEKIHSLFQGNTKTRTMIMLGIVTRT